jgi:signal peptidase I
MRDGSMPVMAPITIDALYLRLLMGAILLLAYAGWTSAPGVYRVYAEVAATKTIPTGDIYKIVRVRADAMSPTIRDGALAVVDFSSYERVSPAAGDIVAIATDRRFFIKRIVAVPGDAFAIKDGKVLTNGSTPPGWNRAWSPYYNLSVENDTIKVDGVPLDRSIARVPLPSWWGDPAALPDDCYFVLGDNVNDSQDSHVFGCVPRQAIVGEIVKVF